MSRHTMNVQFFFGFLKQQKTILTIYLRTLTLSIPFSKLLMHLERISWQQIGIF